MRRLIDCTYLHSVTRCLRGQAAHPDDLANFLRVVGELMLADCLMFTTDRTGPVYRPAVAAALEFESVIGDDKFLKNFEISTADHAIFCEKAALDIAADLRDFDLSTRTGIVSPIFENTAEDPDGAFFADLKDIVSNRRSRLPELPLNATNVSRFVLTRPKVLDALHESKVLERMMQPDEFLRLTAAVRSIVYRHIGQNMKASYLPATSRAKVLPLAPASAIDPVGGLPGTINEEGPLFSLASAVDALVRVSDGNPQEILRRAWAHRKAMLPLRRFLTPNLPGDAVSTSFKRAADVRSMSKEFDDIVAGVKGPRLLDAIEFQFVFFAFPIVKVQGGKFRDWIERQHAQKRAGRFADLVRNAKQLHAVSGYQKLIRRAGFKDDPLKIVDASSNDRPPRLR
jgi:hypothetical protein